MASLQLDNAEIVRAVLQVAALGRDASNMDAATEADVRAIVRSGLRRFYFPVQQGFTYQWRFLEDGFEVSAEDPYTTGTVTVASGTITVSGGTWPDDLTDYYIDVDGHILFVTERTSATVATTSHTQVAVAAGTSFEAVRFRYDLPTDFGEFLGSVVYQNETSNWLLLASEEQLLKLKYAMGVSLDGETTHYAVSGSQILFWPPPETEAFIHGIYLSIPEDSLPADLTTPGSTVQVNAIYAEAMLEAILAAAEAYNDGQAGLHEQRFQAALMAAIAHDRSVGGAYDYRSRVDSSYRGLGAVGDIQYEDL